MTSIEEIDEKKKKLFQDYKEKPHMRAIIERQLAMLNNAKEMILKKNPQRKLDY